MQKPLEQVLKSTSESDVSKSTASVTQKEDGKAGKDDGDENEALAKFALSALVARKLQRISQAHSTRTVKTFTLDHVNTVTILKEKYVTKAERELLNKLVTVKIGTNIDTKMPPGHLPSVTKTNKKIRPSSAAAKLQTHPSFSTGLFDNVSIRPATAAAPSSQSAQSLGIQRPATHAAGPRRQWGRHATVIQEPKNDVLKQPRRLTLGTVEGIADLDTIIRPGIVQGSATQQLRSKIEERINIDALETLKAAFAAADENKSGKLDLAEFKELLKSKLNISANKESQIDALFMKIDWSSEGFISWDEFCTYMQLEYAEKEDSYLRAKDVDFHLPAKIEGIPHRDPVLRITDTPDGAFVGCSQDGSVSFWSSQLELKKTKSVINTEQTVRAKPKWITDFVIMPQYTKFIVGTGDREIQFFELSSFEPYCQISGLETVPLKLDYCATGHDECLIMYGDSHGIVNILVLNNVGECLRTWKKCPKHEKFIASISLNDAIEKGDSVQFIRWKVHGDWLNEIKYYHEIGQVISCSNHANTALVIGCTTGSTHIEQQLKGIKDLNQGQEKSQKRQFSHLNVRHRLDSDQSVFKVYKGVKCFDFSKEKNIIVTGGMDRIVRLWNPYVPGKPTAMLRGHGAPIFFLCIAEEENRIFSFSTDKCLRVWDIQDHTCLLTVRPKGHKIRGDLQACHYSSVSKTLIIATDQMAALNLRQNIDQNAPSRPNLYADIVTSHKEPVTCCMYNPSFKQVVSCSEGSAVKLWDLETGTPIFEYGGAHGDSAITCMTFDNSGRRLITGGRDGVIRIWNYNNGHCLKVLQKEEDNEEICDLTYIEMNKNRYVVAVGWDRRINIYSDSLTDSNIHHVRNPMPKWKDDLQRGHTEDILAVAKCTPNLLATASYDGKIIVWNMVSGHIFCHVSSPVPEGYEDQSLDGDLSIHQLVFMESRAYKKDAASLIASGPRGHIHFWRVFQGGSLMAQFKGCKNEGTTVTSMKLDSANINLYTADSMGFIVIWHVNGYCLKNPSKDPPEMLQSWRGHVKSISTIELMEEKNIIITASKDCTVRLWNKEGHYIGTFGQQNPWDIYNPDTFEHPMVPYDVLIDPMSLPFHPLLQEKQNTQQIIHEDSFKSEEDRLTPTPPIIYSKQQFLIDDEAIAKQIKEKAFKKGTGKRLRHEKLKPVKVDRGGPSEFQMLRIEDLAETPRPKTPTLKVNKNDPFDFSVD